MTDKNNIKKEMNQIVDKARKDILNNTPDPLFRGTVYIIALHRITDDLLEQLPNKEETITKEHIEKIQNAITTEKQEES